MRQVLTLLGNGVADVARAVLAVLEVDLRLAGALDRNGERSSASLTSPHIELARLTLLAALEAGASGMHAVSAAVAQRTHRELEGRA